MRSISLAAALAMGTLVAGLAQAQTLPTGGAIVGGRGGIATSGTQMTVTQNTPKLSINWNSFNIGAGNTVVFQQPSASSVALNTVLGGSRSEIYGSLQANGQVFLVNPAGVLFGRTAEVNVGGLFATTKTISEADFEAGNYRFTGTGAGVPGEVINQGSLKAVNGGFIVLAADRVTNLGTISATGGTAALAAGANVTLALDNAGRTNVQVDGTTLNALIANQGLIAADGGQVVLTARGRDMLQGSVMNLSGVLRAHSIGTKNGQVILDGGDAPDAGTVVLKDATVDVTGLNAGEHGGNVTITGADIALLGGTTIDARGDAGGGNVRVGGDFHGAGTLAHAQTTTVGPDVSIDASATGHGNGGTVVLWSDERTDFAGSVAARGGSFGGDGGWVEVSGKQDLVFHPVQPVDLRAPYGVWGTLLLDPLNISIVSGAAGGSTSAQVDALNSSTNGTITDGQLSAELASSNVVLSASNTISDAANVNVNGAGALTLNAANVNLSGTYHVGGGITSTITGTGTLSGNIAGAGNLTLNGGSWTVTEPNLTGAFTANNTTVSLGSLNGVSSATFVNSTLNLAPYGSYTFGSQLTMNNSSITTACFTCGDTYTSVNSPVRWIGTGSVTMSGNQYQQGLTFMSGFTGSGNVTVFTADGYRSLLDIYGPMANFSGTINASSGGGAYWVQINSPDGWGTGTLNVTGGNVSVNYANNTDFRLPYYGSTAPVNEPTAKLNVTGGTFFTGSNMTIGALTGTSGGTINMSGAGTTLTAGLANGGADLFGGSLTGPGNFVKAGTGTQIFTGNNTYTGTTLVSAGTLQVGNDGTTGNLGTGVVTDNGNLVFDFSNTQNLSSLVSNAAGISGTGNVAAFIGGGLNVDRLIKLTGAASSLNLEAGVTQPAGTASGGDVTLSVPVSVGANGTVTIFSGNPNTATLDARISGATGSARYKTYDASASSTSGAVAGTRNYYYRAAPVATVSNLTATKAYDGTTQAATAVNYANASLGGAIDGDTFSGTTGMDFAHAVYNTSQVGSNLTVTTPFSGATTYTSGGVTWNAAGYNRTLVEGPSPNINITPRAVTVTASSDTKVYDGTTSSSQSVTNINGLVAGDSLTGLTQAFTSPNAQGPYNSTLVVNGSGVGVSGSNGSTLADYSIAYANAAGTIVPRDLTIDLGAVMKVYDATNVAYANGGIVEPATSTTGLVAGDTVTSITGTGAYNSAHVIDATSATFKMSDMNVALSRSDLSNYRVILVQPTQAMIEPRPLTVTLDNVNKVYDGTTAATIEGATAANLAPGDQLAGVTGTGDYNSKDVETASTATFDSATVNVSFAGTGRPSDYAIVLPSPTVGGSISPLTIPAVTGITANDKVYDGTTAATLNKLQAGIPCLLPGDQVFVASADGTFGTPDVGQNKPVFVSNITLGGADAGNYVLADRTARTSASIASSYMVWLRVAPVEVVPAPAGSTQTASGGAEPGARVEPGRSNLVAAPWGWNESASRGVDDARDAGQQASETATASAPDDKISVTQSPESATLAQRGAVPTKLYCAKGGMRVPPGAKALPIDDCPQPMLR
ncbi:beta strand repeat-containing protein [Trinickia fusca]|nr:YDG domain-containing protein [Trinickia fusca]